MPEVLPTTADGLGLEQWRAHREASWNWLHWI